MAENKRSDGKAPQKLEVICPYCNGAAALVDSAEVYHGRSYGDIWLCRPCQAWVGVHRNSGGIPLGRLANAELRRAKMLTHAMFDPLWKERHMSRGDAYQRLAEMLGLDPQDCHIGMFDVATCRRAWAVAQGMRRAIAEEAMGAGRTA